MNTAKAIDNLDINKNDRSVSALNNSCQKKSMFFLRKSILENSFGKEH